MKKSLYIFLLLILFAQYSEAQSLLGKMKFTKVEFNQDSSLVVISKKKKMGLYDIKKQEFVIKPSKSTILPLFERNWYMVLGKQEINVYQHDELSFYPFYMYKNEIGGFSVNEIDENRLLIRDYGLTIWDPDKLDESRLVQRGHQKSGVYNRSTNEWEIQNDYERIYEINNKLVCRKDDSVWVEFPNSNIDDFPQPKEVYDTHYDIYDLDNKNLFVSNVKSNEKGLNAIYHDDLFAVQEDYVILKKDGKYGAKRFNLFQLSDRNYPFLDTATILKTEQKFIHFGHDSRYLSFQSKFDSVHVLERSDKGDYYEVARAHQDLISGFEDDWNSFNERDGERIYVKENVGIEGSTHLNFGISILDSGRIKVIDNLLKYPDPRFNEWGEDMYDELTGEVMYDDNWAIEQHSGIFDTNSESWQLSPDYLDAFLLPNNKFLVKVGTGMGGKDIYIRKLKSEYHILDKDFLVIQSSSVLSDFWLNNDFIEMLDGREEEILLSESPTIKDYDANELKSIHHYSSKDGRMKLFTEVKDGPNFYESYEADFIYASAIFPYQVSLDNETWTFSFLDTSFVLENPSEPIQIHYPEGNECSQVIKMGANNDTLILFETAMDKACDPDVFPSELTITQKGDSMIIISDVFKNEYEMSDLFGDNYMQVTEDYAGSAVWKKDDKGNWKLATPYYAKVENLKNGYLVKTRRHDGGFVFDESLDGEIMLDSLFNPILNGAEEERYLWLKSNLEAKSFMDYYDFPLIEDLGFGVKVCTDNGCMLVTYSGIALTDDVWYNFRVEEERIIGTKLIPLDFGFEDFPTEFDAVDVLFEMLTVDDLKK